MVTKRHFEDENTGVAPSEESSQELMTFIDQMVFLRQVPLFTDLTVPEMGLISKIAKEEEYMDETILVEERKNNHTLFIIAEGFVEISSHLSADQVGCIGIMKRKDCFGEEGIFTGAVSDVTAQVIMGNARIISLDGEELKRMIRLYPEIGIGLLQSTTSRLHKLQQLAIRMG